MAVTFNKPAGVRYVDMAIYIDKNMPKVVENGGNSVVESKIIEYIYHICYALALKKTFFKKFEDYDSYSLYAASEIFLAMRKKLVEKGTISRGGKIVEPVKSSLNFIKAVLFPLKVNYQQMNYATVINPEIGQDTSKIAYDQHESIQSEYRRAFLDDLMESVAEFPKVFKNLIAKSPYRNDEIMCNNLYISCMLTLLNDLTIPNRIKSKINKKSKDNDKDEIIVNTLMAVDTPIQ